MDPFRRRITKYGERNTLISGEHTVDNNSEVMHYKQCALNTVGMFEILKTDNVLTYLSLSLSQFIMLDQFESFRVRGGFL